MIEFIAFIGISFSIVVAVLLWKQTQKNKQEYLQFQNEIDIKQQTQNELTTENIRLKTQIDFLQQQIEQLHVQYAQQEKKNSEQAQLIAQNLVQRATMQLKTENQTNLQHILRPFQENLIRFQQEVQQQKDKGIEQHSAMRELLVNMHQQHIQMQSTAQNLVNALRGEQKMQGDWGEFSLQRILELSGLEKGIDYKTQDAWKDEHGKYLRPDVVVYLPDDKHIIIDSKVSLVAFERFINATDPKVKQEELYKHVISIKTHIKLLGDKDYSSLSALSSPDFVLLFIPLESSFSLAIKEEPSIYEQALSKKIVIVTPSTLLATLKTISSIWKHEKQTKNAVEIAEHAARLYDKFVSFIDDMEKIGQKQSEAQKVYLEAINKLSEGKGNLIRSTEKLKELGVKSRKELDRKYIS